MYLIKLKFTNSTFKYYCIRNNSSKFNNKCDIVKYYRKNFFYLGIKVLFLRFNSEIQLRSRKIKIQFYLKNNFSLRFARISEYFEGRSDFSSGHYKDELTFQILLKFGSVNLFNWHFHFAINTKMLRNVINLYISYFDSAFIRKFWYPARRRA